MAHRYRLALVLTSPLHYIVELNDSGVEWTGGCSLDDLHPVEVAAEYHAQQRVYFFSIRRTAQRPSEVVSVRSYRVGRRASCPISFHGSANATGYDWFSFTSPSHSRTEVFRDVNMLPNELIANWIEQVNEFESMSQRAKRSYKRVCEGIIDHDARAAYDDEQLGCADAVKILRSLSFSDDTPEATVKEQVIKLLRAKGLRHHENEAELSVGILRWSIAVVEGNPERCYNAYHPRRDPPPPRSSFCTD